MHFTSIQLYVRMFYLLYHVIGFINPVPLVPHPSLSITGLSSPLPTYIKPSQPLQTLHTPKPFATTNRTL